MKKKRIIIIVAIILVLAIIIVARIVINANKPKTSLDDFSSVREIVEYDGHEYISMENSTEDGYEKDIYINFSRPSINDDGTTNQNLYEIVISHIAGMLTGQNFRLIDTDKNIVVKIQFNDDDEVSLYTINDDAKYWEHIKSNYQIDNYTNETLTSMTITSQVLANIINNNWIYNNINLGTRESTVDNYEIYFDEGYKVRKLGSEIYNIVFTQNYNGQILSGITSTTSVENVENMLGKPTYEDDNNGIIGYKCEYFYIFFTGDEISIYHPDKYDEEDSQKFGELVTELNRTGDMNTFLNRLTDLYPNYASHYTYNNYVNIVYPLQGFEVKMGASSKNGITLYSNFQGYITDSITMDDLKQNKQMPANVYTRLDTNLVFSEEMQRKEIDDFNRNPYDEAYVLVTEDYSVINNRETYSFYSRDKTKIDSSLAISNFTNIIAYNQTTFVYGVQNDGIYVYNAENLSRTKIVEGQGNFKIDRIENNTIYYDNTSVNL